ncbi:MAG: pyroglutamyl-peptidase I [Sandaracinaceae bacterium]
MSARDKTVLLTAFEPFGGETANASLCALEAVDSSAVTGRLVTCVLPVVFDDALVALKRALRRHRPDVVICCGQAGGRSAITVERVAINVDDARIPDNAGAQPIDRPIAVRGPAAYFSSLPIKAIVAALQEQGIAAEVSQTAGTFVCNHVFYGLMRTFSRRRGIRGGFIHLPYVPEQARAAHEASGVPQPSLPLATLARGLEVAAQLSLHTERDLVAVGGATH